MQVTKVALIGMGTVGTGVARLLIDHGDRTARHAGRTLWVEAVVVGDLTKPRDYDLPKSVSLTSDLSRVLKTRKLSWSHPGRGVELVASPCNS
jgi:homoserine dehydrogenase